jgi:hypothetical protein
VSSAKVLRIVVSICAISAVYIVYNNGPKMLPWGTPESVGNGDEVRYCVLSRSVHYVGIILGD